jgi:LacI family transcriptional regulator
MTVKMKDIARELGVSMVTVSKALRKHPDISKATRERVEAKVRDMNYHPNLAARSLVTGRSALVGLIVPDLIHPFFADIAKGLSRTLREHGYFLMISSSEEDPVLEQQEVDQMLAHRLDAIVVATCATEASGLARVQQGDTPLILVDRMLKGVLTHFVGSDDYAAGKLATEHLLAMGCKRIAHIRGPENSTGLRRLKGFLDTMAKHDRPVPPEWIVAARSVDVDGKLHGAKALRALRDLKRAPDGIFCFNDVVATGVIMEAVRLGVDVPGELAVIGCGNLHFDDLIRVPLSSVDQRSAEIGDRVAKLILELKAPDASPLPRSVVLQPKLAGRASTARTKKTRATIARASS